MAAKRGGEVIRRYEYYGFQPEPKPRKKAKGNPKAKKK
jgi:hypothetical protein